MCDVAKASSWGLFERSRLGDLVCSVGDEQPSAGSVLLSGEFVHGGIAACFLMKIDYGLISEMIGENKAVKEQILEKIRRNLTLARIEHLVMQ